MTGEVSANVGEWSELYALSNVLVNSGAFAANGSQDKLPDSFIRVIAAFVSARNPERILEYRPEGDAVVILESGDEIGRVPKNRIEVAAKLVFAALTSGEFRKTFPLESGSELLAILHKDRPSADATNTMSDLDFVIEDPNTRVLSPRVGFSIKSQLGSASTLLNAGGTTNFLFEVTLPEGKSLEEIKLGYESPQKDVKTLLASGCKIDFVGMESSKFQENLEKLDSQMPSFVAKALLSYYATEFSNLAEVVAHAFPDSDPKSEQRIFKVKQFLGAIAMGLRPSLEWDGDVTKFRGLLVVKSDGDVVLYYLYNLTEFQEFLFNGVKFETASTSRHQFGSVYENEGKLFLKLNLQIRFIK